LYSSGSERRLIVAIENSSNAVVFTATSLDTTTVEDLKLTDSQNATANVQEYKLGNNKAIPHTAQGKGVEGSNGIPPKGNELIGVGSTPDDKKGLYALEDVDLFNILCIPRISIVSGDNALSSGEVKTVMARAIDFCEKRRAFFIIDTPNDINDVQKIKELADEAGIRHKNAALYFPRVKIADPLNEFRLRSFGASGTIAGLYVRTDSNRGVWKAPAGTEANLVNVQALDYKLTDGQNGTLNPLAINCLRNFPIYGNICWGARTLDGADQRTSEWKYIPVRRLALFIEESLYRGTQWVVFEPNDEPLWAQIRLNIGAFMQNLFLQGAFQGQTPREAYLVKCDKETTTQTDINSGIVNILVGFAPLKPAEFVMIQIQQLAGQIQT
jgi:phage tail sheath protein FI